MAEKSFSSQLQKLRKEKGITQEQLATALGVSPQAVSKWENGSYPDGDLLPKLADFFDVSIDYLYGRGDRQTDPLQAAIDDLQALLKDKDINDCPELFERIFDFCWSLQISCWVNQGPVLYYDPPDVNYYKDHSASCVAGKNGISFMRLGPDWKYYFLLPKPEKGYAASIPVSDKLCRLFKFLSDKSNLRILYYLCSLGNNRYVSVKTICEKLNLPAEKVTSAMESLKLDKKDTAAFSALVNAKGEEEKIYNMSTLNTIPLLILLAGATTFADPPINYQMQLMATGEGLLSDKDDKKDKEDSQNEKV